MRALSTFYAAIISMAFLPFNTSAQQSPFSTINGNGKIQVAILLDVSNSMDGLIEQAKTQLWNMVNVLGKAECNGVKPQLEIALYEYGRSTNEVKMGYVKQLSGFTTDLDSLSTILFALTTQGGDEYCGQVIYTSADELNWDANSATYKVIFIAGNEDFLQGRLHYTQACNRAKEKGIIVNTIYCGVRDQGIREHWNMFGECGNGSFTNIDQDVKEDDIPTPYDSAMYVLNNSLNNTYIAYGNAGTANAVRQMEVDKRNMKSKKAGLGRIAAKANRNVYSNSAWDLVDAYKTDTSALYDMQGNVVAFEVRNTFGELVPDSLKNRSAEEKKQFIKAKAEERSRIQNDITALHIKRQSYIAEEKKRRAADASAATLETEIERILKEQVKRFNMKID